MARSSVAAPSSCSPWKCSEGREVWFSLAANVKSSVALNGPLILAGGGIFPGPGEFCFVLFFSHKMGQALLAYISPNYTGIGQHPNLLTSKVNSWGGREGHPRPFSFVDSEVLLKMLCFLEVCARPNQKKKKASEGLGGAEGMFGTWKAAHLLPPSDPQQWPSLQNLYRKLSLCLSAYFQERPLAAPLFT